MNLRIKVCQMQGTTSVIIRNSCRCTSWFLYGQKGAADLQRPSNGTAVHTHSGIGCSLSSSGCVHSSSWAVICAIFAGHSWRIASHRVPHRLHYKRVRSESLLDLINVINLFHVFVLVSPVDITVEDQFYIWLRFFILCLRLLCVVLS